VILLKIAIAVKGIEFVKACNMYKASSEDMTTAEKGKI